MVISPRPADSSPLESDENYQLGLRAYQTEQWTTAAEHFSKAALEHTDNVVVLYNWGLSLYRIEKKEHAVGVWRRAQHLNPDFRPVAEALDFAKSEMPKEIFRDSVWVSFSIFTVVGLAVLVLLSTGYLGIRYFGARRRALLFEKPLPRFPTVFVILCVLSVALVTLSAAKWLSDNEWRATVIVPSVTVHSSPSLEDRILFELLGGSEVIVLQALQQQESSGARWVQIKKPGGFSGWVQASQIYVSSGDTL